MKNNQWIKLKDWTDQRNVRERALLVLVGWAIIYMFWSLLFNRPLLLQERVLNDEILSLKTQITTLKSKTDSIAQMATENAFSQKMTEQKNLATEADQLKTRIDDLSKNIVTKENMPKILNDISSYHDDINLSDLKVVNREPLFPATADVTPLPASIKIIYRNNLEMQFQSSYFKTETYLNYLELLPWRLYLDSLEYKVGTYPRADVNIKFHVLTDQTD